MKVAVLVEGSYPYVFGGVSSWLDGLIRALPHIEFQIVSIMPSRKETTRVNYPFPANVTGLFPIYLQSFQELNPLPSPREPRLTPEQIQAISQFIRFDKRVNWQIIIQTICNREIVGNTVEFLYTRTFWTLLTEYYQEFFPEEPFNEFFWTIRSMFVFFIHMMQSELPEADIYHSVSTGYAGLLGVIATHRFHKPFLLTEHGIYAREREEDILKATWVKDTYKKLWIDFFYFISEAAYHSAVRTVSLFDRNREIQVSYGAKAEHARVIPNGIDPTVYQPKKEKHDGFNIGAVARVVPIKDIKTLLRAFKLVSEDYSEAKLYIMGPTQEDKLYYEECVQLVNTLEMTNQVIFTDRVDVKDWLPKMDLLVLSSISEAQPLIILEGHAMGLSFVATDVGACREMLEGKQGDSLGLSGLIVPPVSPTEMARAISTMLSDAPLRNQCEKNGRRRVESAYSLESCILAYDALYKEIFR